MFERFTERARRVIVLAQQEARGLGHNYIGTEHLMLGLVGEEEGVAAQVLAKLGVTLTEARAEVRDIIGEGQTSRTEAGGRKGLRSGQSGTRRSPEGHVPFTPRAKRVLELSLREALDIGHNYIGTEHILLGLIREGEGVGVQILGRLGADPSTIRRAVLGVLGVLPRGAREEPDPVSASLSNEAKAALRMARKISQVQGRSAVEGSDLLIGLSIVGGSGLEDELSSWQARLERFRSLLELARAAGEEESRPEQGQPPGR